MALNKGLASTKVFGLIRSSDSTKLKMRLLTVVREQQIGTWTSVYAMERRSSHAFARTQRKLSSI
jgi:hypothetical protein